MAESRNKSDRARRQKFDGVSTMTESEMRNTLGGEGRTLYEEWIAICAKYPDSAPCKGRH